MTGEPPLSRRSYLAGAAALLAGCGGAPKLMGKPTRTVPADPPETRTLSFGESLDLADARMTVDDPRFQNVQEWTRGGQQRTARAGDGHQWLFVRLAVTNTTSGVTALPQTLRFNARVGDTLHKPGRTHSRAKKYVGGKVPAGESRSGDLGFLVPAAVSREEVAILYEQVRNGNAHRVVWE